MEQSWAWWIGFNVFVLAMLAADLGFFQRKAHEIRFKEAVIWSIAWTLVALGFNVGLWLGCFGSYAPADRWRVAVEFLQGYIIERSLSFDNLFVFAVVFTFFGVQARYQHRVLFYGILGALVFRGAFIFGGLWLIAKFAWMVYVFGVFLTYTGIKLGLAKEKQIEPQKNPILRVVRAVLPLSDHYDGGKFFTRVDGRMLATPLLLVLIFLEITDVIFAVDSIPAIFGITKDPFIVYTSNVCAILGLRAIYFVLAAVMRMFHYLSVGLSVLLVFIGVKMLIEAYFEYKLHPGISLGIVAVVLAASIAASILMPPKGAVRLDGPAE